MHGLGSRDGDKVIGRGKTSQDYSVDRPGPPPSFFARLAALGIGREGQSILDLRTGTGVLARQFARQGAVVQGVDIRMSLHSKRHRPLERQTMREFAVDVGLSMADHL